MNTILKQTFYYLTNYKNEEGMVNSKIRKIFTT